MPDVRPSLGHCPCCCAAVPRGGLLIEYETDTGTSQYAECPNCGSVVHPTPSPEPGD